MSGFMLGPGEHAHGLESQQSYTWVFYIPKFLTNHEQINKEDISVVIIAVDIVQRNMMEIKLSGWMIRGLSGIPCEILCL